MTAKVYKLQQYRDDAKIKPFVLDAGDEQLVIPPPTADTLIAIGETPASDVRTLVKLVCGDQWDKLHALIGQDSYEVFQTLMRDLIEHFGINQGGQLPGGGEASPTS